MSISSIQAADEGWMENFEAAKAKAAKEKKSLLIDFTGSDWCGWCIKLDKEVFAHDAFKNGVKDTLVLVKLDYPRDKSKMTEEIIAQNDKLKDDYTISGYPTILLTDEKGRPFARTGYQQGGPEKYVESLNALLAKRSERDMAFEKASKLSGVEKATALSGVLLSLELEQQALAKFYGAEVEEIKKADPEDKSGFVKGIDEAIKFSDFESKLQEFGQAGDHQAALVLIEKTLAEAGFEGQKKQQIMMIKGMVLVQLGDYDKSLTAMDEAKAVAPESQMVGRIDMLKQRIVMIQKQAEQKEAQEKAAEEQGGNSKPGDKSAEETGE